MKQQTLHNLHGARRLRGTIADKPKREITLLGFDADCNRIHAEGSIKTTKLPHLFACNSFYILMVGAIQLNLAARAAQCHRRQISTGLDDQLERAWHVRAA
jgi:hypothetical protein